MQKKIFNIWEKAGLKLHKLTQNKTFLTLRPLLSENQLIHVYPESSEISVFGETFESIGFPEDAVCQMPRVFTKLRSEPVREEVELREDLDRMQQTDFECLSKSCENVEARHQENPPPDTDSNHPDPASSLQPNLGPARYIRAKGGSGTAKIVGNKHGNKPNKSGTRGKKMACIIYVPI